MRLGNIVFGDTSTIGLGNKPTRHSWISKVLSEIPAGETILDAGAGECQFKKFCGHLKYTSQDFAQYDGKGNGSGIQVGAWDNTKLDIVSDITSIPVPDGSFDNVMCTEVLEHVPDPVAALTELVRILKKDGRLIITAPFNSLTHFAPYHFCTGFNKYFYQFYAEKLNLQVIELTANGNYFESVGQEVRYSVEVAQKYSGMKISLLQRISIKIYLAFLQRASKAAKNSQDLGSFGMHFVAKKL